MGWCLNIEDLSTFFLSMCGLLSKIKNGFSTVKSYAASCLKKFFFSIKNYIFLNRGKVILTSGTIKLNYDKEQYFKDIEDIRTNLASIEAGIEKASEIALHGTGAAQQAALNEVVTLTADRAVLIQTITDADTFNKIQ